MTTAIEITTVTNADGYYEFNNLKPGLYSVVEVQPTGYVQGLDTAGSLGGVVVDQYTTIPANMAGILAVDPEGSSIVQIQIDPGSTGVEYNFSEVKIEEVSAPPDPPPMHPDPPTPPLAPPHSPYGEPMFYHPPFVPIMSAVPLAYAGGSGGPGGYYLALERHQRRPAAPIEQWDRILRLSHDRYFRSRDLDRRAT